MAGLRAMIECMRLRNLGNAIGVITRFVGTSNPEVRMKSLIVPLELRMSGVGHFVTRVGTILMYLVVRFADLSITDEWVRAAGFIVSLFPSMS